RKGRQPCRHNRSADWDRSGLESLDRNFGSPEPHQGPRTLPFTTYHPGSGSWSGHSYLGPPGARQCAYYGSEFLFADSYSPCGPVFLPSIQCPGLPPARRPSDGDHGGRQSGAAYEIQTGRNGDVAIPALRWRLLVDFGTTARTEADALRKLH